MGLFVDTPADEICRLFDHLRLDLIQLHGDQPPEFVGRTGCRGPSCGRSASERKNRPVAEYLHRCRGLEQDLELVLPRIPLVAGAFGGTGTAAGLERRPGVSWRKSARRGWFWRADSTPENVAAAIRAVRPAAVYVASGVESHPGRKDPARVEAFVQAARAAFGLAGKPARLIVSTGRIAAYYTEGPFFSRRRHSGPKNMDNAPTSDNAGLWFNLCRLMQAP